MNSNCAEYLTCFEYKIHTKQLCIKTCNNTELERLLRRRHLVEASNIYVKQAIIKLIEIELLRRGRINEAGLLEAILHECPITDVKVHYNNTSLLVAIKTFFMIDCLLND